MKLAFFIVCMIFSLVGFSQKNNDEALAMQYYDHKEYDKAVVYLDKLWDKNPDAYFSHYYKTLLELKDYNKAEKVLKKQILCHSIITSK